MAIKLTAESFLNVLRQSGLVAPDLLARTLDELTSTGAALDDSRVIADELVSRSRITRWQAEKLLQGRHKGFFLGKYRLLSLLGKGGMSSVYLAEHVLMRRRCAIKVLPAKRVGDSSYLARFHREAQAVASLDHPNIVRAYDVDRETDRDAEIHFLVMEHVEGRSLQETVSQQGPLDFVAAADYIRQAAEGLAHAHAAGMVHRDVKPGNLLVDRNGTVKILDLGLARFFQQEGEQSLTVAHDEKVLGTADYLAPEQALDSHRVDSRADIYSLGCTLYYLLTGHAPFTEGTLAQRLLCHQNVEPPPVTRDRPDTPAGLQAILLRMMAKNPEDRFQSTEDVARELTDWLVENGDENWRRRFAGLGSGSDITPAAKPVGTVPPAKKKTPQRPTELRSRESGPALPSEVPSRNAQPAGTCASEEHALASFLTTLAVPEAGPRSSSVIRAGQARKQRNVAAANGSSPSPPGPAPPKPKSAVRCNQPALASAPKAPAGGSRAAPIAGRQQVASHSPVAALAKSDPSEPHSDARSISGPADAGVVAAQPPETGLPDFAAITAGQSAALPEHPRSSGAQSAPAAPIRHSRDRRTRWRASVVPAALAAVLVLAAAAAYVLWTPSSPQTRTAPIPAESVQAITGPDPRKLIGPEITVGPGGHFKTIGAALEYVVSHFDPQRRGERQVIRIADGTYAERIVLDGTGGDAVPNGIQIVAAAGARPLLAPAGKEPVVVLSGVQYLTLEGLELRSDGGTVAAKVSSFSEGTTFRNLVIAGFSESGILAAEALGSFGGSPHENDLRFEAIRFQGGSQSAGLRLDSVTRVLVSGCRFQGPMSVGVLLAGESTHVTISETILSGLETGVRFEPGSAREIAVQNNTFFALPRGIVFAEPPAGSGLRLRRNLFVECTEADVVLLDGEAGRLLALIDGRARRENWTTRPRAERSEEGVIDIFAETGRHGVGGLEFVSRDPADPAFLAPKPKSPAALELPLEGGLRPHIGAVAPAQ